MSNNCSKARTTTVDDLGDGRPAPAPLSLPHGHLFFGYPYVAPQAAQAEGASNVNTSSQVSQPTIWRILAPTDK